MADGNSRFVAPVLVLALGDPLRGDAGAGQWMLDALREAAPWNHRKVDFVDGDMPSRGIAGRLSGRRAIVILEAIRRSAEPGTVHTANAGDALGFDGCTAARLLKSAALNADTIANTVVIGIEPEETSLRLGLSPAVEQAVPTAIEEAAAALVELMAVDAIESGVSDVPGCSGKTH